MPFATAITLITPFALALTAIPLATVARCTGRSGASGALPPLLGGLGLLVVSPIVFVAGAFDAGDIHTTSVVLMVAIAVVVFSVTLAVVRRPRALPAPAAGAPLPPQVMP